MIKNSLMKKITWQESINNRTLMRIATIEEAREIANYHFQNEDAFSLEQCQFQNKKWQFTVKGKNKKIIYKLKEV